MGNHHGKVNQGSTVISITLPGARPKLPLSGRRGTRACMSDRDRKPRFQRAPGKGYQKERQAGRGPAWRDREGASDGPAILYGWHTVAAALGKPPPETPELL